MKYFYQLVRLFTGALFIFSGLVKLNDPSGFAIKLNEYFDVFAQDVSTKQDTVNIQCFLNQKLLINESYALYTFDTKKKLEWHINPTKNDNPPPYVLFEMFGQFGSSSFVSNEYVPKPIVSHKVIVSIGPNILFQKTENLDSNNTGIKDYYTELDVSKYVKQESFLTGFFKGLKSYSLLFSILFCSLEVILGFSMLISYRIKLTLIITAILIVFFTFLTGYSAYFNKVTDCGCFGDFLKLKPWDSFKKDIILDVLIIFMFTGVKGYIPNFCPSKNNLIMIVFSAITISFGLYCYYYLPVWDFLPYKKGNNIKKLIYDIPRGERATDSVQIKFVLQKDGDSVKATSKEYATYSEKGYQFVRQDKKVIVEGYKSPIHDFSMTNQLTGVDYKDTLLNNAELQLLFIVPFIENIDIKSINGIEIVLNWVSKNQNQVKFYGLTSASIAPSKEFCSKHHLPFEFYSSDQKMLMTMARYNPTLYLLKGATVIEKWSGFNLPSVNQLNEYLNQSK